jgi:hypothetical protein
MPGRTRVWRNWQTRRLQVAVPVREWRFESSHPHDAHRSGPPGAVCFFMHPRPPPAHPPRSAATPGISAWARPNAVRIPRTRPHFTARTPQRPPRGIMDPSPAAAGNRAGVAELADALDLGSSGATRAGSSPVARIDRFDLSSRRTQPPRKKNRPFPRRGLDNAPFVIDIQAGHADIIPPVRLLFWLLVSPAQGRHGNDVSSAHRPQRIRPRRGTGVGVVVFRTDSDTDSDRTTPRRNNTQAQNATARRQRP